MSETYVVVASQLNRARKMPDGGDWEFSTMPRGTEFVEGDVSPEELRRWLDMKPRVVATKTELEEAQQSAVDARAQLAEAQQQIEALRAQLAEAHAAGAPVVPDGTPGVHASAAGGALEEPAKNGSAEDWRAWVKQEHPDLDPAEVDAAGRDELRDNYGTQK